MQTLPVIFRAQKENGRLWITAVFPTEPATPDPSHFTIYQHIGQHGAGSLGWYGRTRAATPEEYAPLLAELRSIYETSRHPDDPIVKLRVTQRFVHRYHTIRRQNLAAIR